MPVDRRTPILIKMDIDYTMKIKGEMIPELPEIPEKSLSVHVPYSSDNIFIRFGTAYQSQNRLNVLVGRCGVVISKHSFVRRVVLYNCMNVVFSVIEISGSFDIVVGNNNYIQLRDQDAIVWRIKFDLIEDCEEFLRLCKCKNVKIVHETIAVVDDRDKEIAELKKKNDELQKTNEDLRKRNLQLENAARGAGRSMQLHTNPSRSKTAGPRAPK